MTIEAGAEAADSGSDGMDDAALDAAAMDLAKTFGVEGATEEAAPAAKPAADAAPAPAADPLEALAPKPDAAAAEAARIEALVQKQLEARQAQSKFEARLAALEAENATLKGKLGKLKDEPLSVLEEEGWDPEALAGAMVGNKNPIEVKYRQAMAAIKRLEDERKAEREAAQAREAEASARAQAERSIAAYIESKVAPVIKGKESEYKHLVAEHDGAEGAVRAVYAKLDALWRERNQEFPADAVAKHLEAEAKKRFEAIRDKVMGPNAASAAGTKPKPKTLSNSLTQATTVEADDDDLSDEALTKKAIEFARMTEGAA
ncbi:MAG TPA: hypothetical protein VHO02_03160 [Fibrobacteria bacterium]|nr:hypothetical protein [Fibrobacteria bacterium]